MGKIHVVKGILYRILNGGKKESVTLLDVPEYNDCCKYDCCENAQFWTDKDTGVRMVTYIFTGAVVVETYAAYIVKKDAGNFNF